VKFLYKQETERSWRLVSAHPDTFNMLDVAHARSGHTVKAAVQLSCALYLLSVKGVPGVLVLEP